MFLSMNDVLPGCLFAVVVIKCFMIGVKCVMSVLGTTKHSSCKVVGHPPAPLHEGQWPK